MTYRRGLVVGKFAPLHRGHELVVNRALELCDEVLVLSYTNPEFPGCEPALRQRWLERSFPAARCVVVSDEWLAARGAGRRVPPNDAPDLEHRRFVGEICALLGLTADAVFTSEDYGDGFAEELTRLFRRAAPDHPRVAHVLVDRERRRVPISASRIRAGVHAHRDSLPPHVYASFVRRVAVLGGESSGKTTLCRALAEHAGTVWVPEYGRELWVERGGALAFDDLLHIAERQCALEDEAAERANRALFCDTTPATTLFYCRDLFGRADPRLEALAERRYPLTVLCAPDFDFVQDGTRRDAAFREAQHRHYVDLLASRGDRWLLARGSVEERVRAVMDALGAGV